MAKRLSITVPDEMYSKIQELKGEMTGKNGRRKISKICQQAISEALIEAEASRAYRLEGFKDGMNKAPTFSRADKRYISRVLSKSGAYKKWSRFEKIEELKIHFEEVKKIEAIFLYPKTFEIMDGKLGLHEWVMCENEKKAEDRRAEMAWSYVEGFYEGIRSEYLETSEVIE